MAEEFIPNGDQVSGIKFMMEHSYGCLWWDPGTRKTSTCLYAYKLLREAGYVNRMLVVSSLNVVDDVWPEEIERWSDLDVTYAPIRGSSKKRSGALDLDADVYLVNWENLPWLWDTCKKKLGIDMLYVDESSLFRNRGTARFHALRKLLPYFKRRYIGTGTPMPKGYINLWSQMYIVDMGATLGDTLGGYRNRFFVPGGFKGKEWTIREGAEVEIQRLIAPRVHRVESHFDVTISFEDLRVELPPKAMRAYKELEREFITEWRGETITAQNAAVATGKLRQASNGAIYYDRAHNWKSMHTAKLDRLAELIKMLDGEPLLLAYEFDHDYENMLRYGFKFPSYTRAKKGGGKGSRTELKESWNRGELTVLAGQISSMAYGLNVQRGGHNLCYYALTFNLEHYEQLYRRLYRSGQKHDVRGFRLIGDGTVDEVMIDVLHVRDADQKTLLNALRRRYDV